MQTPDNAAGHETEEIMLAICPLDSEHDTQLYNRAYEAIYELLYDKWQREIAKAMRSQP